MSTEASTGLSEGSRQHSPIGPRTRPRRGADGELMAYSATGQSWWLVLLTLLVPDLLMLGYLGGARLGALSYNFAHSTPLPAVMVALGWWQGQPVVLALGLVWLTHIGADRLMGYGLKYDD